MSAAGTTQRRIASAIANPLTAVSGAGLPGGAIEHIQEVGFSAFDSATANCFTAFWVEGATSAPILSIGKGSTEYSRAEALRFHQYYTHPDIAAYYFDVFQKRYRRRRFLIVEPSAGSGSFLHVMPAGSLGFDVAPRCPGIWIADFLKVQIRSTRPIAVVGNPPFGRNASLAQAFFNHAAAQSRVVAFILPRTARKHSFQNKLHRNFHLFHEELVPRRAFLFCGKPYNVTAVFQIWEWRSYERELWPSDTTHPHFEFLENRHGADFAVRRVGGRAGEVLPNLEGSPSSNYFIWAKAPGVREVMIELEPDFRAVAGDVAGNPSLAMSEIVALYSARIGRLRSEYPTRIR